MKAESRYADRFRKPEERIRARKHYSLGVGGQGGTGVESIAAVRGGGGGTRYSFGWSDYRGIYRGTSRSFIEWVIRGWMRG